jgi:hypothetical protein
MRGIFPTIAFACALAASTGAIAQERPDSLTMSCAQAQGLVQRSGAIVVGTGPYVYERYVLGQTYCSREEEARPAWVATADSRQCMIGQRCVQVDVDVR